MPTVEIDFQTCFISQIFAYKRKTVGRKTIKSEFQTANRPFKGSVRLTVKLHSVYYSLLLPGIFMLGDAE